MTVERKLRQAARPIKYAAWRAITRLESLSRGSKDPLLPPAHLRIYYYGPRDPGMFTRSCDNARVEPISRGLRSEHRVLDIGCGIGNLAIGLMDFLQAGYDGVDIHREAVSWCQHAITKRLPSFRFHLADVASGAYNANGRGAASAYRFPFAKASFDVCGSRAYASHWRREPRVRCKPACGKPATA